MTTAQLLRDRATEDQVVDWRLEQLQRAGCRRFEAEILARRFDVDLHAAVELLQRGCPSRVAVEILL